MSKDLAPENLISGLNIPIGWQAPYIGAPWVWRARGPEAYDCWGLCSAVWEKFSGVILPDYLDQTPNDSKAIDRYKLSARALMSGKEIMTEIEHPRPLAICLLRHGAFPSHVGLYAHGGRIVHACEETGYVIQSLLSDIRPKIIGYFWPSDFIMAQPS